MKQFICGIMLLLMSLCPVQSIAKTLTITQMYEMKITNVILGVQQVLNRYLEMYPDIPNVQRETVTMLNVYGDWLEDTGEVKYIQFVGKGVEGSSDFFINYTFTVRHKVHNEYYYIQVRVGE